MLHVSCINASISIWMLNRFGIFQPPIITITHIFIHWLGGGGSGWPGRRGLGRGRGGGWGGGMGRERVALELLATYEWQNASNTLLYFPRIMQSGISIVPINNLCVHRINISASRWWKTNCVCTVPLAVSATAHTKRSVRLVFWRRWEPEFGGCWNNNICMYQFNETSPNKNGLIGLHNMFVVWDCV